MAQKLLDVTFERDRLGDLLSKMTYVRDVPKDELGELGPRFDRLEQQSAHRASATDPLQTQC